MNKTTHRDHAAAGFVRNPQTNPLIAICVLATLFATAGVGAAKDLPDLNSADTQIVRLSTLYVGENRIVSYSVTNTTDHLLTIDEIESSCDCMTVMQYPIQIEPGAVGNVIVNIFGEEKGRYAFAVALQFDDGSQRYLMAQLSVEEKQAMNDAPAVVSMAPPRVGKKWYPGQPKPIAPEVMRRVTRAGDHALYTALESVQAAVLDGSTRVVDLRSSADYQLCRLPGALNMTPVEARTKAFLREGAVLLVDEGWGRIDTERACAAIRKSGNINCSILFGGINAWVHGSNRTEGPGVAPEKLSAISPLEFLSVRSSDDWVVLPADETRLQDAEQWLPEVVASHKEKGDSWHRILILGRSEAAPLLPSASTPTFILGGGLDALENEYRQMTAMRYGQTRKTSSKISAKRWQVMKSGCGCGG